MAGPQYKRVEELFNQAVALPTAERAAFLSQECADDTALIAAVEALLQADSASETFLTSPVAGAAQRHREDPPTVLDMGHGGVVGLPPPLPTLPGYELLEELGHGGMGVVYKARQSGLNRLVAVKMLLPGKQVTSEHLARFRIEAETLARLHHPNIVAIYDIGEHNGQPYFVLQYIPGPSLAKALADGPQDPLAAARLIETVARAIQAVHACGIIHRDLKPANILLSFSRDAERSAEKSAVRSALRLNDAVPHVTDFGLAKDCSDPRKLTQTGATLGTPYYMAPEQAADIGVRVSPATDVYAFGSILYEMLVGRPPFDADTALATLMWLLHDEPVSPATIRPSLPRDVVTICLKCLEKSPQRRYGSALELADDLRRFQNGEPIRARPVGAVERTYRWCRRRPLVASLIGLVGTLAVAFVVTVLIYNARLQSALQKLEVQTEQQRRQIVQLNIHIGITLLDSGDSFAALLRFVEALRLDADGPDPAEHRARIAALLDRCPHLTELLDLEAPVLGAAVTTTGGYVATVEADNAVAVWYVPKRRRIASALAHPDAPIRAAFSADGRYLGTITTGGTARTWDLTTGKARIVPIGKGPPVELLAFHPSGRLLLTEHAGAVVRIWDLTTAEPTPIARAMQTAPVFAVPSPDARWLFTANAEKRGQLWDVATGKPTGPEFALTDTVRQAAVSVDGHRVAVLGADHTVREWDTDTGQSIGKSLLIPNDDNSVTLSPDGRRLLACDRSGIGRLWDVDTGQARTPLLRPGGPLVWAGIDATGERFVTVGKNGIICFWELGGHQADASRPIPEILALAQVHADGYLDEHHKFRPLSAAQARAIWQGVHPSQ
jgi:eukaryotic-like serine/threonine-protein kinase